MFGTVADVSPARLRQSGCPSNRQQLTLVRKPLLRSPGSPNSRQPGRTKWDRVTTVLDRVLITRLAAPFPFRHSFRPHLSNIAELPTAFPDRFTVQPI